MDEYFSAIKNALGIEPYPGTLNLVPKIGTGIHDLMAIIKDRARKIKDGFYKDGGHYGALWAKKALLDLGGRAIIVYIVIPEIDKHEDVIEVIAPFNLRKSYHIDDGDTVTLIIP